MHLVVGGIGLFLLYSGFGDISKSMQAQKDAAVILDAIQIATGLLMLVAGYIIHLLNRLIRQTAALTVTPRAN